MGKPLVEVKGARELRKTLKASGEGIGQLKEANAKAASIVTQAAIPMTPFVTGTLRGSIRGTGQASRAIIRAGGARVPYAGPIHWGWPARHIKGTAFLSDAGTSTETVWLPVYEADIQRIIDNAVMSHAKTTE